MNFHPSTSLLHSYCEGSVDAGTGLLVATHLDLCSCCQSKVHDIEHEAAQAMWQDSNEQVNSTLQLDDLFEQIVNLPQQRKIEHRAHLIDVAVNQEQIAIPSRLEKFVSRYDGWRHYGSKVLSYRFNTQDKVSLMYMAKETQVPQHTHKGLEYTLVLHGGFSDENGHYHVGDFLVRDASVNHSPKTESDQDCLCLTLLTEPMLFTQGIARVLNLFGKGIYP